jgi:hypothetical protein
MGRLLLAAGLFAVPGGICWYILMIQTNRDPGHLVPIAIGNATPESIDINFAVSLLMPRIEGPVLRHNVIQWDEWVQSHFDLRDDAGTKLTLSPSNLSQRMTDATAGTPEFFLVGNLKPGKAYTLDYIPRLAEGVPYSYTFTAPAEAKPGERFTFERYEGG